MLIPKTEDLLPYLDLETLQWRLTKREEKWYSSHIELGGINNEHRI